MKKSDMPAESAEALTLRESPGSIRPLELPEASDFVSQPSRFSLEQMLPLLEQYRQWFPLAEASVAQRSKRKCGVEFIL